MTIVVSSGPGSAAAGRASKGSTRRAGGGEAARGGLQADHRGPSRARRSRRASVIGTEPAGGHRAAGRQPRDGARLERARAGAASRTSSGQSQTARRSDADDRGPIGRRRSRQQVSSTQAAGHACSRSPRSREPRCAPAATVNLTVAKASDEAAVPNVVGQSEAQAAAALGGAGFTPSVVTRDDDRTDQGRRGAQAEPGGRGARPARARR